MSAFDEFETIDAETKAVERPRDHKAELRVWLRLLTSATLIEGEIRLRLRERFDVTLPRFDLMAQLEKSDGGLTLGEVSRRMMVSNGNVTSLVERLVSHKLVERIPHPTDGRTTFIRLTEAGHKSFADMAREHRNWIADMFADLSKTDLGRLMALLGKTKRSVQISKRERTQAKLAKRKP